MLKVRPYQTSDRSAVFQIAFDTALYGVSIAGLLSDVEFIGDALLGAYIESEPEHLLVAEAAGKVVGYLAGTTDSRRVGDYKREVVWLRLRRRVVTRGLFLRPGFWRVITARSKTQVPLYMETVEREYPAHMHVNLSEAARGGGVGRALVEEFFRLLGAKGISKVHLATGTEEGKGFFAKMGFEKVLEYPGPVFPGAAPRDVWVMTRRL